MKQLLLSITFLMCTNINNIHTCKIFECDEVEYTLVEGFYKRCVTAGKGEDKCQKEAWNDSNSMCETDKKNGVLLLKNWKNK